MAVWQPNRPTSEDQISVLDDIIQGNFEIYGDATSAEHRALGTATLSGRHSLSAHGACYYGTTTQIGALTAPPSGAIAYDQSFGALKRFWFGGWNPTTLSGVASGAEPAFGGYSRARWYSASAQSASTVIGDSQTRVLCFGAKTYDSLGEFNSVTSQFVPSADGYYMTVCAVMVNGSGAQGTSSAASATNDYVTDFDPQLIYSTVLPTADGATNEWLPASVAHWSLIDEEVVDTSDSVSASLGGGTNKVELYRHMPLDLGSEFLSGNVAVSGYMKSSLNNDREVYVRINVGGTWYTSPSLDVDSTGGARYYSYTWDQNPATSTAWTRNAISGTGANSLSGIGLSAGNMAANTVNVYNLKLVGKYLLNGDFRYVDEYPTAVDTDYLSAAIGPTTFAAESFATTGGWSIPALAQNISASVFIRAKRDAGAVISAGSQLVMGKDPTTTISGHQKSIPFCALDTAFSTYQFVWANNPVTNVAWLPAEINGTAANANCLTGVGVTVSANSTNNIYMSQIYAQIDWNQEDPRATLEMKVNGTAVRQVTKRFPIQVGTNRDDTIQLADVVQLMSGDVVRFDLTKTLTNDVIPSGTDATYVAFHRMGAGGSWL